MITYVIIVDMRENNGSITAIMDEFQNLMQFDTEDEARGFIETHPLGVFPYEIVEIG